MFDGSNVDLLEVTIARKMLPHPQGMKGSMRNLLNKGQSRNQSLQSPE